MRLIDADKIDTRERGNNSQRTMWSNIKKIIDEAPTVEERPQGEWLEYNATGKKQYMCSKCSMKEKNPKIARYCYWCGAKMKGIKE